MKMIFLTMSFLMSVQTFAMDINNVIVNSISQDNISFGTKSTLDMELNVTKIFRGQLYYECDKDNLYSSGKDFCYFKRSQVEMMAKTIELNHGYFSCVAVPKSVEEKTGKHLKGESAYLDIVCNFVAASPVDTRNSAA